MLLKEGMQDNMVYRVKQALKQLGYSLKDDRIYSPQVARSIKKFQQAYDLPATGKVDIRTWNRLKAAARLEGYRESDAEHTENLSRSISLDDLSILKQGVVSSEVQFLQSLLDVGGIFLVPDGHFGPGTARALKEFQERHSLTVDGIAGPQTWRKLAEIFPDDFRDLGVKYIITLKNFEEAAEALNCEVAAVQAVHQVESRGVGFIEDGRPVILFEGHVFWRELKKRNIDPQEHLGGNQDILYPNWSRDYYSGRKYQYERLDKAMEIHTEAALSSASWGLFQIMGYHGPHIGYSSIQSFVDAQYDSARNHLEAFVGFIKANNLGQHLIDKDWAAFARGYNGPGYAQNRYDEKLAEAFARFNSL
jgi:hypothetical protein